MKKSAFNVFLVLLVEAVSAVVAYLEDRLTGNLRRSGGDDLWDNHPEFI
ncbi:hypothetical protein SAMN05446927_4275 [Caballeronia arationis]|uniref:Uncharacterized protein n=1 Tax=Caballeronia arationis TaxID=1777142 RepID=A0A7Z7I937_9BURK|nr:hypothetical protein [Caballeronia arationis]SOE81021.1 hypothetical protein SAMN05446927_4275 [Caballeronia arationis]